MLPKFKCIIIFTDSLLNLQLVVYHVLMHCIFSEIVINVKMRCNIWRYIFTSETGCLSCFLWALYFLKVQQWIDKPYNCLMINTIIQCIMGLYLIIYIYRLQVKCYLLNECIQYPMLSIAQCLASVSCSNKVKSLSLMRCICFFAHTGGEQSSEQQPWSEN